MDNKQNFLLYIGIACIFTGIVFLLHINNLLPYTFLAEYLNVLLGIIFAVMYVKTKNKVTIMISAFLFSNATMLIVGKLLMTSSWGARLFFVPGVMLLTAYLFKKQSVILTIGSILTFWGIFMIIKEPVGIEGYYFTVGTLMLFTMLAFVFIWIIERRNWPALPILIFGTMGAYLIADELGIIARQLILQIGCVVLIIIGVIFVIKSLFKRHLEEE